ncbi:hypothetical protein TNCT_392981 [Trichonephila clavata]|uniref:Mos1 transposase HTH domain-containing protein n=1 Tax=Trichonephila clavata TaxID=2740835 RepID=A0A8X6FKD8_TRICU|nr:hypothetical protein TNCT_392981 [Trichonephila clavata]
MLKMKVMKEKIWYILQFFLGKAKNASQATDIVNGVYGADTITTNYVKIWFHQFHPGMPIIENVDKITKIISMLVVIASPIT